jgi:hypothetical protein
METGGLVSCQLTKETNKCHPKTAMKRWTNLGRQSSSFGNRSERNRKGDE